MSVMLVPCPNGRVVFGRIEGWPGFQRASPLQQGGSCHSVNLNVRLRLESCVSWQSGSTSCAVVCLRVAL